MTPLVITKEYPKAKRNTEIYKTRRLLDEGSPNRNGRTILNSPDRVYAKGKSVTK